MCITTCECECVCGRRDEERRRTLDTEGIVDGEGATTDRDLDADWHGEGRGGSVKSCEEKGWACVVAVCVF